MSIKVVTHDGYLGFSIPVDDGLNDSERMVLFKAGKIALLARINDAWEEIFPPVASRRSTSPDDALEAKIAQLIGDFEDSDLTIFDAAREIIRRVRQADRAKLPNVGDKYLDTATGDEYEMGQDMRWRRIVK